MQRFLSKFGSVVTGVLSGFDRLVFRGTLRSLSYVNGVVGYLLDRGVRFLDYKEFVEAQTGKLIDSSLEAARQTGRPIQWLRSSSISKEEVARAIAQQDQVRGGLICVLKSLEPCYTFSLRRDREKKKAQIQADKRKCLFLYHYWDDPQFGHMGARIQTWLPYPIQVWVNGREWLARQLDQAGIGYVRADNCFPWIEDVEAAQRLMNEQLKTAWPPVLESIARQLNPAHAEMVGAASRYYWSTYQSEWATDVMFDSAEVLAPIYPKLVRGAILSFGAEQVLRYVRDVQWQGTYQQRILSDQRRREEGVRIKHWVGQNSLKMYDKSGGILRVESTINNPAEFRSYRTPEGRPEQEKQWLPMRRSTADLHRRAEVSHAATERYLDALSDLEVDQTLGQVIDGICRPKRWKKHCVRALRPWSPEDHALLSAIARGEFAINGLRNRDLRLLLHGTSHDAQQTRRLAGRVTRQLRLLRAHGLIRKIPHTQRYLLTEKGQRLTSTVLQANSVPLKELTRLAA